MARDNLPGLVSNLIPNEINKFERKIRKGAAIAGKKITLFVSNEDKSDIIKIIKSLEHSVVLIDGITETGKHEIKKQEGGALLARLATSFVQPVVSSVVKGISGRGAKRPGRGYTNKKFYFRSIL